MQFAIFGISNDGLNLAVNVIVLFLVVVWLALIVWTYADARRRMEDTVLVGSATIAAVIFPYLGSIVYMIVRPPEYLGDAHEREIETRASELRLRQLAEQACPHCEYPIEKTFLRCPNCRRRVKDPCTNCSKPLDPRWGICPYCETEVPRRQQPQRQQRPAQAQRRAPAQRQERQERQARPAAQPKQQTKQQPKRQPQQQPQQPAQEQPTRQQRPERSAEPQRAQGQRSQPQRTQRQPAEGQQQQRPRPPQGEREQQRS